eukprot:9475202-Pyramimonas_sp.AAC.2
MRLVSLAQGGSILSRWVCDPRMEFLILSRRVRRVVYAYDRNGGGIDDKRTPVSSTGRRSCASCVSCASAVGQSAAHQSGAPMRCTLLPGSAVVDGP